MKNTIKLYAVDYCEKITLNEIKSIRTHSRENAIKFANFLKECNHVLYAQVATYKYNKLLEFYEFIGLKYYYKN